MLKIIFTVFIFIYIESASASQCKFLFHNYPISSSIRYNQGDNKHLAGRLINALMRHFDIPSHALLPTDARMHELIMSKALTPDHIRPLGLSAWMLLEKAARIKPGSRDSTFNNKSMDQIISRSKFGNPTARTRLVSRLQNHLEQRGLDKNPSLETLAEMIKSNQLVLFRANLGKTTIELLYKILEDQGLHNTTKIRGLKEVISDYPDAMKETKSRLLGTLQKNFVLNRLNPNPTIEELQSWIHDNTIKLRLIPSLGKASIVLLYEIIENEQSSESNN